MTTPLCGASFVSSAFKPSVEAEAIKASANVKDNVLFNIFFFSPFLNYIESK
jgi:hypothetical protein